MIIAISLSYYLKNDSLLNSDQFLNWVVVLLQVSDNGLILVFWHLLLSGQDPKVVVVGAGDNGIVVVFSESDDPVLSSNVQSWNEFHFQLSICTVLWDGLSAGAHQLSVSGTVVNDLNALSVWVQWVSGNSVWASSLKVVWDNSLFVPWSAILLNVNIWDWNWLSDVLSQVWLNIGVIDSQSNQQGNSGKANQDKGFVVHLRIQNFNYAFILKLPEFISWSNRKTRTRPGNYSNFFRKLLNHGFNLIPGHLDYINLIYTDF